MARADIPTLLSLDQWAQVMSFEPFQFNQIGESNGGTGLQFARDNQCSDVFYQYSYQKQFLSRTEVASAIAKAEAAIFPILNFYPAPNYVVAEEHNYPNDYRLNMPDWLTPRGLWKSVGLNSKFFCEIGTISRTAISANQAYVSSDTDGDGVNDTFTITVATTETNPDYIAVYFNASDRQDLDETWRIRPIHVTISGGNAVITGHLSQLTDPALQLLPDPVPLQVEDTPYVSSVDVYQVKPDTTTIGTAYWNSRADLGWCYGATSAAIDSYEIALRKENYIRPIIYTAPTLGRAPDRVEINYLSGIPLRNGKVQAPYAQMIAYLATSYLPAMACGCDRVEQILRYWSATPNNEETGNFPITTRQVEELGLPPTRGGFYAFSQMELVNQTIGLAI